MKLVTVLRTFNPAEADLVRSRLEAAGFAAILTHSDAARAMEGYALGAGGILVQVPEDESGDASALLNADPNSDASVSPPNAIEPSPDEAKPS